MSVIIIGGGAAGLMAAYTLSKEGHAVTLLEARDRLGGRIHTLEGEGFTQPAEGGAEFVHGNLPVTLQLLKEANIDKEETEGELWRLKAGHLTRAHDFIEQSDLLMKQLDELKEDLPIEAFLDEHFAGSKYDALRESIRGFVEGYDAADISKASTFALREEWEGEDEQQYRPVGGYAPMIRFMAQQCRKHGGEIRLSEAVESVEWSAGEVAVYTRLGLLYKASRLIVTIPLSLLQMPASEPGTIRFQPDLPVKLEACRKIGMGQVIKILFEFSSSLWKEQEVSNAVGSNLAGAAWFFSGEAVPTWWTQLPRQSNLLTGWLAGPKAAAHAHTTDEELITQAIGSLANILSVPAQFVREQLIQTRVFNWANDPYSRGAYAYNTTETVEARKILLQPEADTIFFAGEALYEGKEMGTVEGALSSGKNTAESIAQLPDK